MFENILLETIKPDEILIYLRKSRSDDPLLTVEEVLTKHEKMLDEWAEKYIGGIIPKENRYREIVSGETIENRPEIQKVLKLMESPKYKAILIVEIQRLSRGDLEDAGRLMKLLRYTNTAVITPQKTYDLRNDFDRDFFERELKRGNEFLEYTKKIMLRGRLASVSEGNFLGSIPPYGYDKVFVTDGKKKCPILKINPEEAEIVKIIFDMYVHQDCGWAKICNHLDDMGVKPPKGDKWAPGGVRDMISNVHYLGKVKWNWRKSVNVVEDGEVKKMRPKAHIGEYMIFDGKHEAIIPEELFAAAQEKRGKNHRETVRAKLRNPFASISYCKKCGRALIYKAGKKKDGTQKSAPRIMCVNQRHCISGSCLYEEFSQKVISALAECIEDFEIRLKNDTGDAVKLHAKLIKNLEKRLEDLQAKELSQWETQSHPDPAQRMPAHIFKQLNEKLLKEKEEIQAALCKAYESMPEPVDYEEKIKQFKDALEALRNPKEDAETKSRLIKACIERIDYSRDKPERTGKGSFPMTNIAWTNPPIELDIKLKV